MNRIRLQRLLKGWSQYELGQKTGISQSFLSLVENEYRVPSKIQKRRIAKALGVKIYALFSDEQKD